LGENSGLSSFWGKILGCPVFWEKITGCQVLEEIFEEKFWVVQFLGKNLGFPVFEKKNILYFPVCP